MDILAAFLSAVISLIIFAIGYGRVQEKIETLQHGHVKNEHEIEKVQLDLKVVTDLRVDLAEIKKDIHYIKEKIQ